MDDTSQTLITAVNHSFNVHIGGEEAAEEQDDDELCDAEAWQTLSKSLKEVQSVLDHNRRLIHLVNENHRSKVPHNLTKNVDLIREINANISKVVGLYSNLSANFSGIVQQRRAEADKSVKKIDHEVII